MSNNTLKSLSIAVGVAFVGSLAISQAATASGFSLTDLDSGYQVVGDEKEKEGQCGEGKCGADKDKKEGACGEGKCGGEKDKEGACGEGKCGGEKDKKEGSCGEGKCGGEKDKKEGSCGGAA